MVTATAIKLPAKGVPTERVKRLRESLFQTDPRLCCERLKFQLESLKETDGQPAVIRFARVYEKHLCNMTLYIDENPIVGSLTKYRGGILPYPELSCDWMINEFEFHTYAGKMKVTEEDLKSEDRKLLEEAVAYWKPRCKWNRARAEFSKKYGFDYQELYESGFFSTVGLTPYARINIDYGKVVDKGFEGVIAEAEAELAKLSFGPMEDLEKKSFLEAVIIVCNAVIKFARRYAALARDMASKESSPERKAELMKVAETCEWVPAKPARTFLEAVQSFWFTHLGAELEAVSAGISPGRFPLYMNRFYVKDLEEGRTTEEEAIELLELLFIKFTEIRTFLPRLFFGHTQGSLFQNIAVGGVNALGEDATCEMDFLLLEAQQRVRTPQPTLSVLVHNKINQELMLKAVEVVRTGIGMPAFFNNDINIQRLLNHGGSLEDARNCCLIGCVEGSFSHVTGTTRGDGFNMPKMMELTLNNGVDPMTGKQWGVKTGDPRNFKSYQELHDAVLKQLQHIQKLHEEFEMVANSLGTQISPRVYLSALVDDCIKRGKELNSGGARYRIDGNGPVGMVDLADSLAAIKKLVFEEKSVTMDELIRALKADFAGYEELHKKLVDAPKYGNDIDYVDSLAQDWYNIYYEEHQKYKDHMGCTRRPPALSVSFHFPLGMHTGALPCGRRARIPLTDGSVSPSPGMDKSGPTALIRSATRIVDCIKYASNLLNMKFHPSALESREAQVKLLALIRTYMSLGGHHIQFNVVSVDTLKDAQLHPENYRDLIVRVAGFSAFFIHLEPMIQNEIIKRTELSLN